MLKPASAALIALTCLTVPANADEVTDTLENAIEAYNSGDIQYAIEELDYAKQLLNDMKTTALTAFLPKAPEGWGRDVSDEMNSGLAMMGGGAGAEATYSNDDESVTITMMADNPMVVAMASMIANASMLGLKVKRVGRQKFLDQDGDLTALIDNRILVQASGGSPETMIMLLELIDFDALADFGK